MAGGAPPALPALPAWPGGPEEPAGPAMPSRKARRTNQSAPPCPAWRAAGGAPGMAVGEGEGRARQPPAGEPDEGRLEVLLPRHEVAPTAQADHLRGVLPGDGHQGADAVGAVDDGVLPARPPGGVALGVEHLLL